MSQNTTCIYLGEQLARYGFSEGHPFGPQRHNVFKDEVYAQGLDKKVDILKPVSTPQEIIELFHTHKYVEKVRKQSVLGVGYLDQGDTPAFKGMFEAASTVVGTVVDAIDRLMKGEYQRAFTPIAGMHHARRVTAAGFSVFNDCGIAIEYLRHQYNIQRVAYVDIDAHHGDGVFYSFEDDVDLLFADIHQDGHTLYPGTGHIDETGTGEAQGTKLNIPMPPGANDEMFEKIWPSVERYLEKGKPSFILFQCGADSIKGDPITSMAYSPASHALATRSLKNIADNYCEGKLLVLGGGGYSHENIASTWATVVKQLCSVAR